MDDLLYLVDLTKVDLSEKDGVSSSWVHSLAPGEYQHPVHGKISVTPDKIVGFAESVKAKVRGIDPSINYKHDGDGEAAGWVKDAEARTDGLWVFVEWTTDAARKIKDKAFRYFSAEYYDTWKDASGKEHSNVLFGGALTNRPYMKNLVPVNLSEDTINFAVGLAEAIKAAKDNRKEVEVDLIKLNEMLGLPKETSEEDMLKKFAEITKKPEDKKGFPQVPAGPQLSSELVALAEDNPLVKGLLETMTAQNAALKEFRENLLEESIAKKLAEFDQSKIVLTPKAKDAVHDLLVDMPVELHERFWSIMSSMRTSAGMLVELGERSGANVRYGRAKDKASLFMDEVDKLMKDKKISFSEAMDEVSRTSPDLYNGYRTESYAGGMGD